jgi:hypothetical protein
MNDPQLQRSELYKQIVKVCALSGGVAHDCDHHGISQKAWWRAVQKLQKMAAEVLEQPPATDDKHSGKEGDVTCSEQENLKLLAVELCQIVHNSSTNTQSADCIYERLKSNTTLFTI